MKYIAEIYVNHSLVNFTDEAVSLESLIEKVTHETPAVFHTDDFEIVSVRNEHGEEVYGRVESLPV